MSTTRWVALVVCLMCVFALPITAVGDIALGFSGGAAEDPLLDNGTWGWTFDVSDPIVVTHLGFYATSAGLVNSHQVGIWSLGGPLLVNGTVDPGTGGGWHWTSVTGTSLGPGSYVIGAYYNPNDPDVGFSNATSVSMGSGLSYGENRYFAGSGFDRPDSTWSGYGNGVFGPNFLYTPEPALLQLPFLIAAGGASFWWRTRKRQTQS